MKLLEHGVRTSKDGKKKYTRFEIRIPSDIVNDLKWKKGMELEIIKKSSGILIKKKN